MDTTGRLNMASYGDYSYRGQLYYGNLSPSGKMSGVTQADPYGYTLGTQDRSKLTGFLEQAKNITFSQFVAPVTNFGGQSPGLLASKVQQSLDTNKPLRHIFKSEYAEMMQSGKVVGGTVDTTNFDSEVLNPVGLPPGQKEVAKMQKVATQYVTVDGKQVPVITGWSSKVIHHVKYLLGDIEDSRKQEYRQQYTTANINVAAPNRLVSFMTGMFTGTSIGGIQTGDGTGSRTKENPYEDFVFITNNPTIVSWFDDYETKTKKNEIVNYSSAKVPGVSLAANTSIYIQRNQDLSALIESGKPGLIEIASPAWTWNELARENKSDDALQKQVTAENLDLLVTAGKQGSTIVIYTDPDRLNIPSQYKRYLRKHAYFAQSKYGAGQHSNVQTITTDDTRLVSFGTQRVTDNRQINAELRFDLKKIVSENLKAAVQYIPDRLRATHNVWKLRERVSDKPVVWSLLQQYYSPAYSDLQKKGFTQTGKMPVMPTVMPEDFYRYFAPGTDVTMYTDRYRALAGENPQGIQSYILATLDKKLSDPGLGVLFNQVTGQSSLYQSGRGVVETAAASLGRFLDTMTGYYTLKTFRAREEGELSGSAEEYYRRRYSYPYAKDEQRGFFENLFTNTTNIVSATTVSMASYFGVTHAYSLARAEIESVGVDYMLNTIAAAKQDAVGNLFLGQMLSPQHALLIRKAEEITEASRTADNLISHSGLGLDLYLKQSFNQVTQQLLSDLSLNLADNILADKALNVENVSNALAPEFTRGSYNSNFRVLAIFDDLSAANGESFGGILKNKLQQKITAHGLTEAIDIGHLNQWMYEIYSEMGINLSEGQVDLGRDLSGVPTYRVNQFGGFINLAGVRRLDSSNLANMFIPLLDEIVYDASDVKYQVAKSSLIHLSSANPILTFKVQMGSTYNATQLDIQNYGYTRMENLAKVFDTLAEHIPANPFMWIKPIRQLFSARPDAPSLSQLNIEGYNNQQYAGASFKDLIGPGFSGLITLQKQIAREVGNMARVGLQKHFTEAFGIFQTTRQFERASREFSKVIGVADNAAQATAVVAGSINSVGSSYNNLVAAQQDYHRVIATQKHSYLDSLQSESPKSQSFAGLRRFMLAAGTVLIVDRLVDTYLIRPQGADYFDTVLSDVFGSRSPDLQNDNDEQYSALYATKYSAGVPAAIKYGSAAAGYFIGGHIFPDYTTEDSPVYALLKQRFGGTATADDIIRGVDPAAQLTGAGAVATEAADNAKLITKTYTKARFGGGGALLTSLAALVGSQLLVSYASAITQPLVQTAAGIFLGRRYDPETGLQLDAAKASVSGVLAEIVARSAQSQADAYQRGEAVSATDKANTYVLSLLANQMQVSDAKPTQVFYSFATQIASPFFQFASVSKVDPRNNRVEMAGGLQLFPLLGVGMMLPSPLMPKVRYTEGISTEALRKYLTVYRRGSTSETVPLNADQQMQVSAFTNAQEQDKFNSLLLGGGMNLGFDPKGLIYLSMVGAAKEKADNLYQRYSQLPEGHKLRRELQEYKTLFQLGKVGLDTLEMVSRAGMSIVPSVPNYLMQAGIAVTNAGYTVTHRAGPLARVVSPYALSFAILGATFRFRDKATDADITQHSELLNQLSSGQTTTAAGIINKYMLINLTQVAIGTAIVGGTLASTGAFSSARSFADSYNLVESGAQSNYIQRKQHKIYQMWLEHLQKVKEIDLPGQPKVAVSTVEEATAAYAKITEQLVKGDNLEDSAAYYKAAQQIDLPLLRTMPTRLGMAARRTGPLLLGAIVAAQYLSVMDEFKDSPWFGVFKTLGDVRTSRYTPEQMALLSSLGIRQPKYMARNYGDATRNSLDYILSAATLPFGNMFGLFRDDPNPFAPVVGSIGASLGSNDNARLYVQSQSVAADISGSLYLMPEMVSQLGLAMQYGNLLKAASGENKLSESIAYHLIRGSSLRRTPAKIKGGPGINEYRAATSPLLQIAIANRYERIKQLSWQSASEIYLDVVRDFARAGRIKNDYLEGTADGVISTPVNSAKLIIYDTLGNLKMSRYRNSRDLNYRRKDNSLPFFKAVKSMLRSAGTFGTGIEVETQEDLNDFNKRSQDKQGNQILSYFAGLGKYVAESYYDTSKEEYQADNTNMAGAAILTLSTAALALSSAGTFTTAIVQAAGALAAYNEHGTVQNLREEVITLRESSIRRLSKTRFSVRDGKLMRPSYNNGLARTLNVSVSNEQVSALNQVFAVASDYNGYMQGNANPLETIASSQLNTVAKQIASAHLGTGSNFLNLVTELQDVKNSIDSVLTIVDDADKSLNVSQAIQKTAGQIEFFNVNEVAAEIQTLLQQNTSRQSIQLGIERILLRTFNEGIARVTHYEAFETSKEPYFNPTYTSQEAYSKQKVKESMRQQVSMAKHATEAIADYDPSIGYLRSRIQAKGYSGLFGEALGGAVRLGSELLNAKAYYELLSYSARMSSSDPFERRRATYAAASSTVQTFGFLIPAQYLLKGIQANPKAAVGGLVLTAGLFAVGLTSRFIRETAQEKVLKPIFKFGDQQIYRPFVSAVAGLYGGAMRIPGFNMLPKLISPITSVIDPIFYNIRRSAEQDPAMSFLANLFIPEDIESFYSRQSEQPRRMTHWGPSPYLYSQGEVNQYYASKAKAKRRRGKTLGSGLDSDLVHSFLTGSTGENQYDQLLAKRYLSGEGRILNDFTPDRLISNSLRLALERRQGTIDQYLEGRYYRRPVHRQTVYEKFALVNSLTLFSYAKTGNMFAAPADNLASASDSLFRGFAQLSQLIDIAPKTQQGLIFAALGMVGTGFGAKALLQSGLDSEDSTSRDIAKITIGVSSLTSGAAGLFLGRRYYQQLSGLGLALPRASLGGLLGFTIGANVGYNLTTGNEQDKQQAAAWSGVAGAAIVAPALGLFDAPRFVGNVATGTAFKIAKLGTGILKLGKPLLNQLGKFQGAGHLAKGTAIGLVMAGLTTALIKSNYDWAYGLVHDKKAQEERRKRDGSLSEFVWSAGIGVGLTASSFGSARLATTFTGSSLGFVLSKSSKLTTLSLGFATRFYVAKSILDNYYTGAVARTAYSYIHRNLLGKREEDLTADYNFYTGVAAGTTALGVPLLSAIGDRQLIKRLSRDLEVNRVSTQLQGVSDAAQQMSQAEIKLGELVNQLQSQQTRLSGMGQAEDAQKLAEQIITTQESIKKATRLVQLRRQGGFFSNFTRNTFNTGRFALDIGTGFVALSVRGLSKNFKVGLPLTAVAATAAAGVAGYQTSSDPFYMTAAGTTAALATTAILGSIYKLTDPVGSRGATELLSIVANQLYHLPGKVHNRLSRNSFYRQKTEQLFGLMDNKLDWLLKDNRNLEAQYGAVPKRVGLGLKPGQVITKVAPALALGSDIFTLYTGAKQVSNLDAMDGSHEYLATYKAFESSRSVIASMSVLNLLARKATFGTAAALILQTSSMGEIRGYEKGVEANLLNLEENYGELTNKRQREYWESAGIGALSLGSTSLVMLSHSKYAQLSTRTKLKLSGSAKNLRNLDKALDFAGARVLPAVVQSYMAHNRFAYMSDDANQQYLVGGNAAYGAAKDSADISGLIGYGVMMAALASRPKNLLLRGAKVFAVVGGLGMGLLDDNLESTFFNNYQKRFQKEGISSYYAQSEIVRKARQSAAPTAFTVGGVQLGVSVLALIASKGKASGIAYNLAVKGLYTTPLSATVAGQIAYQNTIHSEINDRTQYDQGLRPDEAEAHNQYARTGQVPDKYKDTKDARFNQRLNNVLANVREDYIKRVEDQADGTYDVSGYSIGAVPIYKLNQKQLYTDTIKAYKKQVEETKPDLMQYLFAGGALAGLGVLTTILPKEQPHIQATATAALPTNGARVSKLSKVGLRGLHIGAELIAPIFQLYEAGRTSSEASLYNYSAGAKGWGEFLEIESQASAEYTGAQLQGISTAASAPLGHVGKIIVGATAWGTETLIQPIIKSWRKQDLQRTLDQAEQKDPGFIVTPKVLKDLSKIRSEYVREEAGSWTKLKNYLPAAAAVGLGIAAFLAVGAIGLPVLAALGIGALVAGGTFVATKAVMDNAVIQKRQDNYLLRKETRKNLGKSAALRPYQTASITSLPPKEQEPGELETFTDDILTNQYFWGGMVSTVAPIVGFGALSMRALKRVNNNIKHFTFNEAPNSVVEMTSSVQPLASPEATLKPVEPQPITEATLRPIEPQPTVESITQPVQPVQPVQQPDPIQRVQQPEPVTPVKPEPIAAPQTSSSSLPSLKDFLEDFDKPDSILEPSVPTPQPAEQTVVKPVSQPTLTPEPGTPPNLGLVSSSKIIGYKTAKGSIYLVNDLGQSQRYKRFRDQHGITQGNQLHPEFGLQEVSPVTLFVQNRDLSIFGSTQGAYTWKGLVIDPDRLEARGVDYTPPGIVTGYENKPRVGLSSTVSFSSAPQVGSYPIEFYSGFPDSSLPIPRQQILSIPINNNTDVGRRELINPAIKHAGNVIIEVFTDADQLQREINIVREQNVLDLIDYVKNNNIPDSVLNNPAINAAIDEAGLELHDGQLKIKTQSVSTPQLAPPAIPVKSKPIEPQTLNLTSDVRQTAPKSVASSAPRVESTQAITQADIDAYNADPNYWKVRPGTEIVGYFRNDMNVSSSASGRALNRFLPTPQQIATFVIVKVNNETFVLPRNDPRILSALDEGANNVFRYLIKEGKVVDAAKVRLVDNETYEVKLDGNYDLALSKQNSGGAQQQDGGFITLSQAPTTEERKWLTRRRYQRIGSAQAKGIDYQMLLMDMVYGKSKEAVSGVINKAKEIRRPVVQGIRKSAIGLTDRVWTGSWMDGVISRATGLDARFGNVGQVGFFQRWATGARYEFSAKGMFEGLTGIGRGADGKIGIQGRAGLMALAGTGIQFFDDLISGKSAGQIATNVGLSIASGIAFGLAGAGLAALAASSLPALATVGTIGGIALAAYGVYSLTDQALGLSGKVYEKFILGRKRTREESLAWERQRQGIALGAGAGTAIYQGYNAVKRFRFVAPTVARTVTSRAGSATATLARSVTSRINPIKALRWTGRAAQVSTVGYSIYQIGSGLQQAFFGESNKARDLGRRKAYREVLGLIGAQAGGALGEQAGSLVSTITVNPITIGASRGVSKVAGTIAGYELATRGADNSYNTVAGWFTNAQSFLGNILSNVPVLGDFFFPKVASAGEIPFGLRSKSEQHKIIQQSARRRTAGANYTLQSIQGKEQKVLSFLDGEKASAQPKEDSLSWWEWLLKKAMETLGSIGQATSGAVKGTVGALGDLGNWMWQGLSNTAQKAWQSTTRFLSQAGSGFIGAVRGSLQSYNNFRRSAWQGVRSFSNWVGSTLGQFVPSAWRSKINTGLSETWVGVANELQNNAMFDPSTREGRAATAVALGLGFIESNPSWSVDQMFSAMGGGGGLMRGFAQIHTGVHARNKWETKQGYTQTVGEWVTGRALTPSSGGRFNLQGFMADIDAGKVTNDPASFYGAMKRHGFRVNDWQALGDGIWRASPNQIQAVLDFYKKGGKLEPTGAQDVVSSSVIKVATPKSGTAFFTGQRTGPKGTMGAGTAYHQHLEFGSAATDAKLRVALVDAIAKGVESQGMKMTMISRFGNRRYNPAADLGTKSGIIQTYIGRHTHSGPKQAVDFFAHEVEGTTQGKEVRMLAPIIPGASYTYRTGGGAGLALYVKDPKGNLIFKLFHGNEQLEKPKDFKMPGEYKGPIPVTVKDIKNVKQTSAPAYPVAAGVPLTSGFGMRVHPITGVKKMHRGVDFGAPMGAPVYAVLDGVVSNAGWNGGYGNQIALTHGNEASSYAHLSGIVVKPGQKVTKGQLIGFIGSTGLSTGPHLHFEWKQKTKSGWQAVNPMPVLKAAQKGINYGTAAIEFVGDPEYRSQVQQNVAITQQTATTPVVVSKALKLFDTFARKDELQQRITTQKNESNEREPLEVLNKALEFEANQLGLNLDEVVKVMQTSRTSLEVVKTAGLWNNPLNYVRRLIKQVLSKQQTAQTQQDSDSVFKPTQSATRKVYRGRGRSESLAGEFIQQKTQALQSGIRQFQQQASQTATQAWEVTKQGLRAINPFAQRVSSSRQTSEQSRLVSLARSRATNKRRTGTGGRGSNPQPTRLQRVQQTVQRTTQVINKVIQRVGNATRQSWQTIQQGAQKLGNWWNKLTNPKRSQPSKPPKRQGLVISTIPTKYTPQISTQPVERLVASANLSYLINTGINQPQLNPPVALEFSTQRSINLNDRKPQKSTTPPAVPGMYQPTVNQEAIQVAVATTDAEVQATVQAQQNVVDIATAAVTRANQIKANQAAKLYEPVPNTNNVASVSPDPYVFAVAAKDQRAKKTQSIAYYDKGEHKVYYAHPVDPRAVEAQLANGSQFIPNDHDDYARGEAVVRPIAS